MGESLKGKAQIASVVLLYSIGFIAITMIELLSVNQNMETAKVEVTFKLSNLINQLPSLLVTYAALGCYTAATIMMQISKFKLNNDDYKDFEAKISDFSKKEYRPVIFNRYCMYTNRNRKIKAYKKKMHTYWRQLEKRQTDADYNAWCEYQTYKKDDPTYMTTNKYCLKREKLERLMSDQYIEENIDKISVKYDVINASLVLGGVMSTGDDFDSDDYVTKNKIGIILSEQLPRTLLTMGLVAMASSITVDAFQISTHWAVLLMFFFKMLIKIFSIVNTIFSAIRYTETYNAKVTMKDIRFRWGVCCEYESWLKQEVKKARSLTQQDEIEEANKILQGVNSNE